MSNIDNVQGRVPVAPKPETPPYDNLVAHELATIFPLMEDDQFDALVADILRRGLLNPITLYQGNLLPDVKRGSVSPLGGVAQPAPKRPGMKS